MREILLAILKNYLNERKNTISENTFAHKIRSDFPNYFKSLVQNYGDRYIVKGSHGQGNWADCPWIAILDTIKTTSAKNGYYVVYLFDKEMNGVYLSLNQGVTFVKEEYKRKVSEVLTMRAKNYRSKLNYLASDKIDIILHSSLSTPKLYEKGNILATYYAASSMPNEETLKKDFSRFLSYYQNLIALDYSDTISNNDTIHEVKKLRLHERFDRRGDLSAKVKAKKGYTCEACDFCFSDKYGKIGSNFIEAHHLIPFASLDEGKTSLNLETDFAVLCSNCHRMIHRLDDPSNLSQLREVVQNVE